MIDFEDAKDRVLMGPARRSLVMNAKEKLSTAYHEAGHTLVARLSTNADPVHKVTIIPRGMALGITSSLPSEDRYSISKDYCLATLRVLMAGRAAEEVVFNQYNSGAANDLQRATQLAHKMVCDWGMSTLGPLSFGDDTEVFLGRDFARRRDFSEQTATEVDREIHVICKKAYDEARELLEKHQDILKVMAEALVERETLDAHEIDALIRENGGGDLLPPPAPDQTPPPPAPMDPAPVEDGAPAGSSPQVKPEPVPGGAVPETA
jgi:cell division protease FtsH